MNKEWGKENQCMCNKKKMGYDVFWENAYLNCNAYYDKNNRTFVRLFIYSW